MKVQSKLDVLVKDLSKNLSNNNYFKEYVKELIYQSTKESLNELQFTTKRVKISENDISDISELCSNRIVKGLSNRYLLDVGMRYLVKKHFKSNGKVGWATMWNINLLNKLGFYKESFFNERYNREVYSGVYCHPMFGTLFPSDYKGKSKTKFITFLVKRFFSRIFKKG